MMLSFQTLILPAFQVLTAITPHPKEQHHQNTGIKNSERLQEVNCSR